MEKYQILEKIGEGTYGVVFRANNRDTGEHVALKLIHSESDGHDQGISSSTLREISVLSQFAHPNIVRLIEVVRVGEQLSIAFEYIDYDLKMVLDSQAPAPLDPILIKSFLFQVLQGIAYCHRHSVVHRDLKPSNILITHDGLVKLADFGLACPLFHEQQVLSIQVVTLWYRAPELLIGYDTYSSAIDIWSVGCIFAELVNMSPLFCGQTELGQLSAIVSLLGTPSEDDLPGYTAFAKKLNIPSMPGQPFQKLCPRLVGPGLELLERLLEINPSKRISAHDALLHPFFADLAVVDAGSID